MTILVTGGAGYIGSHTVAALLAVGYDVVVYDNLSKGHRAAVPANIPLIVGDIRDKDLLCDTIKGNDINGVIHFAANSLVGESMANPLDYYHNNVFGTLNLLTSMLACGLGKIVFSSTAAVYGEPETWPIHEDMPVNPTNVYGRTKLVVEGMLRDFAAAYSLAYVSLRYFNAAGARPGGLIGEDHNPETHLIPLVLKTALGRRPAVDVFGTDYPTPDGSCIRDYIHVDDLADAHVKALQHLERGGASKIYNLGSEAGFSVKQVINTAKAVTGLDFPVRETGRRAGDPAILVASSARIRDELNWRPGKSDLSHIIESAWEWHRSHPEGYGQAM